MRECGYSGLKGSGVSVLPQNWGEWKRNMLCNRRRFLGGRGRASRSSPPPSVPPPGIELAGVNRALKVIFECTTVYFFIGTSVIASGTKARSLYSLDTSNATKHTTAGTASSQLWMSVWGTSTILEFATWLVKNVVNGLKYLTHGKDYGPHSFQQAYVCKYLSDNTRHRGLKRNSPWLLTPAIERELEAEGGVYASIPDRIQRNAFTESRME